MRTTISLEDDVAAEVDRLRRSQGIGLSEAVNRLVREGLQRPHPRVPYQHRTVKLGLRLDVTNIADVLELLDDDDTVTAVEAADRRTPS